MENINGFFSFECKSANGKSHPLAQYKKSVVLVVNVASYCGFTPQYEGLEKLYEKYKDQGFVVIGFPCNQFGAQEPDSEAEILQFCSTKFSVKFPIMAKVDVNGPNAHPVFEFLKKEASGILGTEAIKWNFTKFLVGRSGQVIKRYAPTADPESLIPDIEKALAE